MNFTVTLTSYEILGWVSSPSKIKIWRHEQNDTYIFKVYRFNKNDLFNFERDNLEYLSEIG